MIKYFAAKNYHFVGSFIVFVSVLFHSIHSYPGLFRQLDVLCLQVCFSTKFFKGLQNLFCNFKRYYKSINNRDI